MRTRCGRLILVTPAVALCLALGWPVAPVRVAQKPAQAQPAPERFVVRLSKQIHGSIWLDEDTILTTLLSLGGEGAIALINLKSGDIRVLAPGDCPSVSPDRMRLVLVQGRAGERDAWILDLQTGARRQLTNDLRVTCVSWSPDGQKIAVVVSPWKDNRREIRILSADTGLIEHAIDVGPDPVAKLAVNNVGKPIWSPDSNRILFTVSQLVWTSISPGRFTFPIRRIGAFDLKERKQSTYFDFGPGDHTVGGLALGKDGGILLFVTSPQSQISAYDGRIVIQVTTGRDPAWHPSGNTFIFARGYECNRDGILCNGDDLFQRTY